MRKRAAPPTRKRQQAPPAVRSRKGRAKAVKKKAVKKKAVKKKATSKAASTPSRSGKRKAPARPSKASAKKHAEKPVSSRNHEAKKAKTPSPPVKKKRAAAPKRAQEPALAAGARQRFTSGEALKIVAVVDEGERGALVVGGDNELWAFLMPALDEALKLPFSNVTDAWLSTSGALYLAAWMNPSLVRYHEGAFEYAPSNLLDRELMRVTRLTGVPGATPSADTLFGVDEPYTNAVPACRLFWRKDGEWRALPLPLGHPGAIAASLTGEAFVSLSPTSVPERRNGLLFRLFEGKLERLAFPAEEDRSPTTPSGLHVMPDGSLLAFFGWGPSESVRPWLRGRDGTWSRVEAREPFNGCSGRIACREWRGKLYIPAEQGVFVWDGRGPIRKSDGRMTISLWPGKKALIASSWEEGSPSQRWFDGRRWRPLLVPAPEVVAESDGKRVRLGEGNEVSVREVRLSSSGSPPRAVRAARGTELAR